MSTPTTVMRIRLLMRHGSVMATIGPILFKSNQFLGMETDQPFLSALIVEYIFFERGRQGKLSYGAPVEVTQSL